MTCRCDIREHPRPLDIPPGLTSLPRTQGLFADWLAAMRAARSGHVSLRDWSTHFPGDLGVMLLEFWAVVCEVQSFYDAIRADECYLPTAKDQRALERLIALLGYVPRPAVAASAWIAFEATGVRPATLPVGTALRSGPVGDEPPQVFELDAARTVFPALGKFDLEPPPAATVAAAMGLAAGSGEISELYADPAALSAKVGDIVVLQRKSDASELHVATLATTETNRFGDERDYALLTFDPPFALSADTDPADLALWTPALSASLWSATDIAGDPEPLASDGLSAVLATLNRQVVPDTPVTLRNGSDLSVALVASVSDVSMTLQTAGTVTTQDGEGNDIEIDVPAITVPVTKVTFDRDVSVGGDASTIRVGFGMVAAATIAMPPPDAFSAGSGAEIAFQRPWRFRRNWREREPIDTTALIVDPFGDGAALDARVHPASGTLEFGADAPELDLAQPVTAYANAALASRGESVWGESLGSGDGAVANQSFELAKGPLTFRSTPTERGVEPVLTVWIDGVAAEEVLTFFGAGPTDLVYTVRANEDGDYLVTFGDGIRGTRLATGAAVTADYRFGAGAAAPEAGSISQLVSPSDTVTAVHQPFAAYGGGDAEGPEELRESAPQSALLIGRAISLADFEAAARMQPGVDAARADWAWSDRRQRPVARVWFAGDAALASDLTARLRALADPSTPIEALAAEPVAIRLAIQIAFAEGYRTEDVLAGIRAALTETPGARLAHDEPRIGAALLRSPISAEVLAVPGTWSLSSVRIDDDDLTDLGIGTALGTWFTIDPALGGALVLNGEEGG